jgi:E3 ubiquitin-protein ligase MYCBP2
MTKKIAEEIILLLKDMTAAAISTEWADITKSAVAEAILNLTRIEEAHREPGECLKEPALWLALASLCVLDKDHVDGLSSGEWNGGASNANGGAEATASRPTCDNHDDGETLAIILCDHCGNLCADCDRFLHLHRKTKAHQR